MTISFPKNKMRQIIIVNLLLAFLLIAPVISLALAAEGVVPPCNTIINKATGKFDKECGFPELLDLANRIIKFLITIGALLAAISITYAGWLYIQEGAGKKDAAKDIFVKVFWGFVMMLAAWLIVSLVLKSLGYTGTGLNFLGDIAK